MNISIKLLIFLFISNQSNSLAQEVIKDNTPLGKWKVEQQFSPERKVSLEFNIKYSEKYKRYFGSVLDYYGHPITLDSINFKKTSGDLTFSYHDRSRLYCKFNIQDSLITGEILGRDIYPALGYRLGAFNPNVILEYDKYQSTQLPIDILDLYWESGNLESRTVLIVVQGGPFNSQLHTEDDFRKWKDKLHIVFAKQAQQLNNSILPPENNLSFSDAYNENLVTVEVLHRIITHFKRSNKKVIVWGSSYGGWLIQKYISEYGIEADAVGVSGSRLDIEAKMYETTENYRISYEENIPIYTKTNLTHTQPAHNLIASINKEKYTKLLKNVDLSKFITYHYGAKDGNVGKLNKKEIEFLELKGVEVKRCNNCYHRQIASPKKANYVIKKMLENIK